MWNRPGYPYRPCGEESSTRSGGAKKNNSRPENFPEFLRPGFTEDVRIPKAQGEHGGSKTGFALAHCEDNLKQVQSEMTPAQNSPSPAHGGGMEEAASEAVRQCPAIQIRSPGMPSRT